MDKSNLHRTISKERTFDNSNPQCSELASTRSHIFDYAYYIECHLLRVYTESNVLVRT